MSDSYYQSRYTPSADRGVVWPEIVRFLKPYLSRNNGSPKDVVLDLGAGYCDFINNVSARERIAVDMSEDFAQFAGKGVRTIKTVVTDLSAVEDAFVDVVFSSNLLEHLSENDLEHTMNEVKRVLKSGGLFISMQPNYRYSYKTYFDDPTHRKVFSHEALRSFLVSHDLEIVRMMPKFLPFSLKSRPGVIPVSPWIVRAYMYSPWKPFAGQMLFVVRKG